MICKHCGQENPDESTFCQSCGKRLDGKKVCPVCGAKIDEEAKFCGVCGANFETAKEEVAVAQAATQESAPQTSAKTFDKEKINKYVSLTALTFACIAAVVGLIFTFLIGVEASAFGQSTSQNIYHYFGDAYKDLSTEGLDGTQSFLLYLPNIMGTVVSAGAILFTVCFALRTAYEGYKQYSKKQENANVAKYAVATYISFAVSATLFLAMHAMTAKSSGISVSAELNGATLAGLILGGISLGVYYCCRIYSNLETYKNKNSLIGCAIALGVAVLAMVVVGLAASPVASFKYSSEYTSIEYAGGYNFASSLYLPSAIYLEDGGKDITMLLYCLLGNLSQIIVAISAGIAIVKLAGIACGESKEEKVTKLLATTVLFAVANLVCAILSGGIIKDVMSLEEGVKVSYGMPIALLVISAIALAGTIAYKTVSAKSEQ